MERNVTQAAKEIQSIKIEGNKTIQEILSEFFEICEKYNIKQGTQNHNNEGDKTSVSISSMEWVICKDALTRAFQFKMDFFDLIEEVPKQIKAYEKK